MRELYTWLIAVLAVACLCVGCYFLGRSHVKTEIVEKKIEVIKYVSAKKAKIYATPNASRDSLLELMHQGEL